MSLNNKPVKSTMYVRLVTENELRKDTVKRFYNTVKSNAPENVLSVFEVQDLTGNPSQTLLLHRLNEDKKHEYEIPLTRNLTSNEIYEVVLNLDHVFNEGDFLFETSTYDEDCCPNEDDEGVYMEAEVFEQFAERLSSRLHEKWLNDRVNAGWRYGEERNDESKTHPLIKPWNQLNETQRQIDYSLPEFFIELLEEFQYTVISNEELDELVEQAEKK